MSVNSTSSYLLDYDCFSYTVSSNMFSAPRATLVLPLSTLVLYLDLQRWRQQHSFKTANHSDIFTYHVAAMELIWVFGCLCSFDGTYSNDSVMSTVGSIAYYTGLYGEMGFHVLTCVERYLAVVHPITYLGLRNARGVQIRNISIGCVWLLSFGLVGMHSATMSNNRLVPLFCILAVSIIIISFCSLSVLCVLIRPGPGEGAMEKEQIDQSKLRAFHTITAITCTMWLWFGGLLVTKALSKSPLLSSIVKCVMVTCAVWFNLPSCLVLFVLYLQRPEKLSCC